MNKNTVAGAIKEKGGELRAKVDEAVGDEKGAAQGRKDQLEGNLEKNFGKIKDAVTNK